MAISYGTITITDLGSVTKVDVYYYVSTSATKLEGGSWSTDAPVWSDNKYIWSKTVTTWEEGRTTESNPACITGAKGTTGQSGRSVQSIKEQYYLSTSSTSQAGGSWQDSMPTYVNGRYYWTHSIITWKEPNGSTTTETTTAVLANALTSANSTAKSASDTATAANSTANAANTTAGEAKSIAQEAQSTAGQALTTANNKNKTFYQNSQPTGGSYLDGDSWYDTNDDNKLYIYNGTSKKWVAQQFGNAAIADSSITNAKIANATIQSAKIISLEGAKIVANSITANKLATDAIKSNNYQASPNTSSPYSAIGTFLDLSTGNIYTPNFGVDSVNGAAHINGQIIATSGQIGDSSTNYWQIGTYNDYNMNPSAAIIGNGTSYIQSGTWQISNNRINTQTYDGNNQITYMHYGSKYWDYGMQVPELDTTKSTYIDGVSNNWLYIRRSPSNSIPSLETDWEYLFRVDKDGTIYENGVKLNEKYASIDGVSGAYLPRSGGTITGNLTVNGTLTATASKANALTHTLTINGQSWSGSANLTINTLGVAYGGTGKTTGKDAANYFLNSLDTGSSTPVDGDYYISQYVGGGTTTTTYHRRPMSALWLYVKSKLSAADIYVPKTGGTFTGAVHVEDEFYGDSATLGNLIVNGSGRFNNGIYGDLTGTATRATKVTDSGNNTDITFAYSKAGMTTTSWLAAWNGYELRVISPANVLTTIGAQPAGNYVSKSGDTMTGNLTVPTLKVDSIVNEGYTHRIDFGRQSYNYMNFYEYGGVYNFYRNTVTGNADNATLLGKITINGWEGNVVGNATSATKLDSARSFTVGKTTKNVDWSGAVSFSQAEISDNASTSAAGWMSKDDKVKLNGIETGAQVNTITGVKGNSETSYRTGNVNITASNIGLGNVTNNKQVKGLSSGTTSGNLVTWGSDGYTVVDSGIAKGSVTTKITLSGTDYTVSSNTITITKANLQSAVQDTSLVLMTSAERSKLSSIQVSEGGTIDFSGVTASAPITATVNQTTKAVNITHNTSGVTAGTYRSVTVNTYGHITAGTNPTTLSGYGITDAKIASGVITLGSNTITPLTASSTLDATKLSGTASISTTGNATTATKFNSNRSITLTGDVTGSALSNGENGWSIATTVGDDSHNHTEFTIVPKVHKTYESTSFYATSGSWEATSWYFFSIRPNSWYKPWKIKFKIRSYCPNYTNVDSITESVIHGRTDSISYSNYTEKYDNGHYYIPIYTLKKAGYDAGYGHAIGISILYGSGYTTAAYYRTFELDYYSCENCTVTILDAPVKWADWVGTGTTNYNNITSLDAVTRGYTESGDRNDVNYNQREYYASRIAYKFLGRYQLLLTRPDSKVFPVNTTDNDISTSKTYDTDTEFDPFGQIFYHWTSGTTAANANVSNDRLYNKATQMDLRYAFNVGGGNSTSLITARQPFYLVAVPQINGMAKIHSSGFSQTLPTSDNGLIYIYLGTIYEDTNPYRLNLTNTHPIYWYKDGAVRPYVPKAESSISATKATQDSDGNQINTTYLKLAGGTMTGILTAKKDQYTDSYSGALNMNNSNIYGVNSIYTADASDNSQEGIHFFRDTTHVDSIYAKSGVLYFTPNRALGTNGTSYSIYHAGNKPSKSDVGLGNVDNTADANKIVKGVSGTNGTTDTYRHVWFSDNATETNRNYDDDFKYNPSKNDLKIASVTGTTLQLTNWKIEEDSSTNSLMFRYVG